MKITSSVHYLKIPFQIPLPDGRFLERFANAYLIYGKKIYLIDSGVAGSGKQIFSYIEETGRSPEEIAGIMLTHSHPDHIGGAFEICQSTGCAVYIHPEEKNWAEDVDLQNRERPVPGFNLLVGGSVKIARTFADSDLISLDGGPALKVIHTPGHSKGSVSLALEDEGVLFTGDAVPIPKELPIFENWEGSYRSQEKLKKLTFAETLLSSWGEPYRGRKSVENALDSGLVYLDKIRETVFSLFPDKQYPEPMEICRVTLSHLGIPPEMGNPLIARSFISILT